MWKDTVQCHSTIIVWDHVESRLNSEHLQLAESNPKPTQLTTPNLLNSVLMGLC